MTHDLRTICIKPWVKHKKTGHNISCPHHRKNKKSPSLVGNQGQHCRGGILPPAFCCGLAGGRMPPLQKFPSSEGCPKGAGWCPADAPAHPAWLPCADHPVRLRLPPLQGGELGLPSSSRITYGTRRGRPCVCPALSPCTPPCTPPK